MLAQDRRCHSGLPQAALCAALSGPWMCLCLCRLPAINDITVQELQGVLDVAAKHCPVRLASEQLCSTWGLPLRSIPTLSRLKSLLAALLTARHRS
jgi:hypothetical protein